MRTHSISLLAAGALGCLATAAAIAQEPATRNATVAPGKVARIAVVTALKRDCSVGEVGSVRVTTPPKNGSIEVRGAKMKTPASFRCPNVETPVQQVLYKPNAKFTGTDEISYETRSPDGATQTVTVKINVSGKSGGKDLLDL